MKRTFLWMALTLVLLFGATVPLDTPVAAAPVSGYSGSCYWSYSNGVLAFSGNGPMENYNDTNLPPWIELTPYISQIVIYEGVTSIGDYAFSGCYGVSQLYLPQSLTRIGNAAFLMCSSLGTLTIPKNVTQIGLGVFGLCEQLTTLYVDAANPVYFAMGNCIIEKGTGTLTAGCTGSVIPSNAGIKTIGEGAFMMFYGQGLAIPEGVTRIAEGAFAYAEFGSGYSYLTLPSTLTELGEAAFCYGSLPYLELPDGITHIPDGCFIGTSLARKIKLPSNLKSIGTAAFMQTSLNRIDLPAGLKTIGDDAFFAAGLVQKVVIPQTVESIGVSAFSANEELYGIEVNADNPYYKAINGCLIEKESGILISACTSSSIPANEGIRVIGPYSFAYLETLYATIPDGVTKIEEYAFYGCEYLVGVRIPASVRTVGERAFAEEPIPLNNLSLKQPLPVFDSTAFENNAVKNIWVEGTREELDAMDKSAFPNSTWHFADNDCDYHCELCGSNRYTIPHVYSGNCDTKCNACSFSRPATEAHRFENDCDTTCDVCGAEHPNPAPHVYDNDCDADCNACGAERLASHQYDDACDSECNLCHTVRKAPHVYSDKADLICDECGHERPAYTPGDVDGNDKVDLEDAIYFLFHVNFPEFYPVEQPTDFNQDSKTDLEDAIYFLFHVNFPEFYPL